MMRRMCNCYSMAREILIFRFNCQMQLACNARRPADKVAQSIPNIKIVPSIISKMDASLYTQNFLAFILAAPNR
jgi:hypothetical protein